MCCTPQTLHFQGSTFGQFTDDANNHITLCNLSNHPTDSVVLSKWCHNLVAQAVMLKALLRILHWICRAYHTGSGATPSYATSQQPWRRPSRDPSSVDLVQESNSTSLSSVQKHRGTSRDHSKQNGENNCVHLAAVEEAISRRWHGESMRHGRIYTWKRIVHGSRILAKVEGGVPCACSCVPCGHCTIHAPGHHMTLSSALQERCTTQTKPLCRA
jgi:hypothetical protein